MEARIACSIKRSLQPYGNDQLKANIKRHSHYEQALIDFEKQPANVSASAAYRDNGGIYV
jgi:hypothetical protein